MKVKPIVTALTLSMITTSCMADINYDDQSPLVQSEKNLKDASKTEAKQPKEVIDATNKSDKEEKKTTQATNDKSNKIVASPAEKTAEKSAENQPPSATEKSADATPENTPKNTPEKKKITQPTLGSSQYSRVNQLLNAIRSDKDFVVSETGITQLLTAIAKGAAGDSKVQIEQYIPMKNVELTNDAVYKNANLMYVMDKNVVEKSYLQSLVNFSVADSLDALNKQVSEKTDGAIKKAIDSISPNTKLILSNVMTFNGKWQMPFDPKNTVSDEFTALCDGKPTKTEIPMMNGKVRTQITENAIALPFNDGYQIVIALSDEKDNSSAKATQWLYENNGEHLRQLLESFPKKVAVTLPKLDLAMTHKLIPTLKKMGIEDIFDKNKADLSKVSKTKLFVDQFQQAIQFKADETGAEAAAVTTATMVSRSLEVLPEFTVNRPFAFAIVKKTDPAHIVLAGEINQLSGCQ